MADPFRNLRRNWHLMRGTPRYTLKGVVLRTGETDLPRAVRDHIFRGSYEAVEADLARATLRPADRILEVGTGIGFVSLVCAKLAPDGQVTSYEANPEMEAVIRANYAENGLIPDLHMKAVTVDGTPIRFFADPGILSSSMVDRDLPGTEITVNSEPISKVIAAVRPDVIVMDVEGAETDLLPAADLSGVRDMIVEVHPHIVGADAISAMDASLADQGFVAKVRRHKTVHYARGRS